MKTGTNEYSLIILLDTTRHKNGNKYLIDRGVSIIKPYLSSIKIPDAWFLFKIKTRIICKAKATRCASV
jgi:hypothetical protein